jgi:mRNA-degrading endonuclease RelE of RelBE toxin-antitoxin system
MSFNYVIFKITYFSKCIANFLSRQGKSGARDQRLANIDDPRSLGKALQGPRFDELWRYRVGDYRLICKIEDDRLLVLVLRVEHRNEIYR